MSNKNPANCIRKTINSFLFLLAISILLISTYQHFYKIQEFNTYLGLISVFILIVSIIDINTVTSFSIGLITLQRKINEADHLLERLREIITPISEVSMTVAVKSGRMISRDPIAKNRLDYLRNKIEYELKKIYSSSNPENNNKINEVFTEYHKFILFDLALPVFNNIQSKLSETKEGILTKINAYQQPITQDDEYKELTSQLHYLGDLESQLKEKRASFNYGDLEKYIHDFINSIKNNILDSSSKKELLCSITNDLDKFKYYLKNKQFLDEKVINND